MTTLLAFHDRSTKRGYMAADGRASTGDSAIASDECQKIVRVGAWLIGTSGTSLAAAIIRENIAELEKTSQTAWQLTRGMVHVFAEAGWRAEPGEKCESPRIDSAFLLAHPSGSYTVYSNFCPQLQDRPCSLGSGGAYAAAAFLAFRRAWELFVPGYRYAEFPVEGSLRESILTAYLYDPHSGGTPQVEVTE